MIDPTNFIAIGEKIHCSRVYKSGGVRAVALPGGGEAVTFDFKCEGAGAGAGTVEKLQLPLPADWRDVSPAYANGQIKHVAAAVHLGLHSDDDNLIDLALKYLFSLAQAQLDAGAAFIDLNVDEYSPHPQRCVEAMKWLAGTLAVQFPEARFAIDSSNPAVMRAGLEAASANGRHHMANSISLERTECIQLAVEFEAEVMASAAGRESIPADVEGRLANLAELLEMLDAACVPAGAVHIDPLVLPLSTGSQHGRLFLDSASAIRERFDEVHVSGGLSNVSFGMPRRKLLNMVFIRLAVEAGCDGGIIDPVETSVAEALAMDLELEKYRMARDVLLGVDEYGMEFILAHRDGRLD